MFKKKLLSAAVVALLAGTAHAQLNAPVAAPKLADTPKPVAAAVVAQPVAAPAAAEVAPAAPAAEKAPGVNPFMGKTLSLESRQRELETAKMETALLEERIKQAGLAEDLKSLPLKKSVEAAQANTARLKEELLQKDGGKFGGAAPAAAPSQAQVVAAATAPAAAPAKAPKNRPAKKTASKVDTPADKPVAVAPPVLPKVEVTSVLSLGGVRSAVLDIDGNILPVKHGDSTPLGVVEVLDNQSVRVGGKVYKVHGATLARIVISDPKPVDPKAAAMGIASTATPMPAALPPQAAFSGGNGQPSRSGTPALPPLQLPSGVTIIPPAGGR